MLFKLASTKYYVSSILDIDVDRVMLSRARKYGERGGKLTFIWSQIPDVFPVPKLDKTNATPLPSSELDLRGTSLIFKKKAFGKVPLAHLNVT